MKRIGNTGDLKNEHPAVYVALTIFLQCCAKTLLEDILLFQQTSRCLSTLFASVKSRSSVTFCLQEQCCLQPRTAEKLKPRLLSQAKETRGAHSFQEHVMCSGLLLSMGQGRLGNIIQGQTFSLIHTETYSPKGVGGCHPTCFLHLRRC